MKYLFFTLLLSVSFSGHAVVCQGENSNCEYRVTLGRENNLVSIKSFHCQSPEDNGTKTEVASQVERDSNGAMTYIMSNSQYVRFESFGRAVLDLGPEQIKLLCR